MLERPIGGICEREWFSRMLKKSTSCVLGPLSCSRTPVYASRSKGPADLPVAWRVSARWCWEGEKEAFLNILQGNWCWESFSHIVQSS